MNNNNNLFSIPFIGPSSNNDPSNNINNNPNNQQNVQPVPNLLGQTQPLEQPLQVDNTTNNFEQMDTISNLTIPTNEIPIDNEMNNNTENDDLEKTVIMSSLLAPQNQMVVDNNLNNLEQTPVDSKELEETQNLIEANNQIPFDNQSNDNIEKKTISDLLKPTSNEEEIEQPSIIEQSGVPDLLATPPTIEEKEEENNDSLSQVETSNINTLSPIETNSVNTIDGLNNVNEVNNINVVQEPVSELPNSFDNHTEENEENAEPVPNLAQQFSISSLASLPDDTDKNKDAIDSTVSNMLNNLKEDEADISYLDDDELLKEFVGEKYYEVGRHKFFNIWGFLFGPFYLIYRKMYLLGILFIIIQNVLGRFLNEVLVSIILGGIIGLFFNLLYGIYANNKIKKIKKKHNSVKTKQLCRKKGGKSLIGVIILLILYIIVMIALTIILGISSFASNLVKMLNMNPGNTITDKYDGHTDYYAGKLKVFMDNTDPEPGAEITISDTNLLMVVMPKAKNDEDYVTCILDNRNSEWHNGEGLFRDGSTNCKEYMENAERFITEDMYPFPDSITISFNSKKELGAGTILTYGKARCIYNQENKKFECKE